MILSGQARLAGVMGWPVHHSLSPRLHGYWLEQHGIDGAYLPLAVRPEAFETALRALVDLGFRGVNVTVPHKQAARAACHQIDPLAERIGAVNTIVMRDGRLLGSNSDAFGFIENLKQGAASWRASEAAAVVLGAGGGARAVVVALLDAGAPEIRLINRTRTHAEALARDLGEGITVVDWDLRAEALAGAGLLVNTTSLGMAGQAPLDLDLAQLPPSALVSDVVYTPLETELLARARSRGNPVVDGLGMLLYQAQAGFEAWFGLRPEVTQGLRDFVLDG